MLFNNLRIAYRNLIKNRIFSYINILGLSIAMAAFLFLVQYIRFEYSYEDFHQNANNIFRITTDFYNGSEYVTTDCETYAPLGPTLKEKMPEVVDFVRMYGMDGLVGVRAEGRNFLESHMYWTDPSAFRIFTYRPVSGDLNKALIAPFEVVLTESLALKYFGSTDIVDKSIEINKNVYRIKAVIADVPPNTQLKFSALLSRLSLKTLKPWYPDDKWNNNNEFTYVLTEPGTDVKAFNKNLMALWNAELRNIDPEERFTAEPVKDIHLYSNKSYEPEPGGNAQVVHYFTIIALFTIVIAWVNYINLSTARAVERAREVGIRKVMGSQKLQLVLQFLSESFIVNLIAGLFALLLVQIAFPFFRELSGQPIPFNLLEDPFLYFLFVGLILAGAVLSGTYPAFVLAAFNPAAVLKGKFKSSAHGKFLRKGLVIFQFGATVVMIICVCTVYLQVQFLRKQDLGMNISQTLVLTGRQLNVPDSLIRQTGKVLKTELLTIPSITAVSRGETLPGIGLQEVSTTSITRLGGSTNNGKGYEYYYFSVDADYISTMGMTLAAGRNFEQDVPNHDQVIINEEAVKLLGFSSAEQAVSSKITFRTRRGAEGSTIIGVLKNFHFRSPKERHLPMLFCYGESTAYFAVNVKTADISNTISAVKNAWDHVYPNSVFNYFFLDETYDQQYKADVQFGTVMATFSGLIIIIACLGLFGLASYTTIQRTREIGIRKVLGASVTEIVRLLSVDFAQTVIIASLIALPLAYVAMDEWLSNYFVHISLNAWIFVLAIAVTLSLAMLVVSFQTIRAAVANPTDSLKQE